MVESRLETSNFELIAQWVGPLSANKFAVFPYHVTIWFGSAILRLEQAEMIDLLRALNSRSMKPAWFAEAVVRMIKKRDKEALAYGAMPQWAFELLAETDWIDAKTKEKLIAKHVAKELEL